MSSFAVGCVTRVLKRAAEAAGLPTRDVSGHSLRAGFVAEAIQEFYSQSNCIELGNSAPPPRRPPFGPSGLRRVIDDFAELRF